MYNKSTIVAMLVAAASAEIRISNFWNSKHDWTDWEATYKMGVNNGIAYGTTPGPDSWITGGWSAVSHVSDYVNLSNVQQV